MNVERPGATLPVLDVRVIRIARTLVVELAGEADISSWRSLESLADTVLADDEQPDDVLLDVTRLSFCDVRSVRLIADFCEQMASAGITSLMRGQSPPLARVAALAGARLPSEPL